MTLKELLAAAPTKESKEILPQLRKDSALIMQQMLEERTTSEVVVRVRKHVKEPLACYMQHMELLPLGLAKTKRGRAINYTES